MKALSIRQPWAWLIVNGFKDIENRNWETNFRGPFLVHAGKQFDYEDYRWVKSNSQIIMPEINEFEMGGIVGSAEIIGCVTQHTSQWFFGPYGFVLKNARTVKFVPLRGQLNFFNVEVEVNFF
jgi:hypothetical protein